MKKVVLVIPFIFLQVLLISACGGQPVLVDWSKEFVAAGMDGEDGFVEPLEEDYFSVKIEGDTITATALMLDHCVDKAIGAIECKDGIIYLTSEVTFPDERHCPEYYKYTYVIYNPGGTEYEIIAK